MTKYILAQPWRQWQGKYFLKYKELKYIPYQFIINVINKKSVPCKSTVPLHLIGFFLSIVKKGS